MIKLLFAIAAAVIGAMTGSRWIERLYEKKPDILSFPHQTSAQNHQRRRFLPAVLGTLFAFYLLTTAATPLLAVLQLFYIYFLVLFTFTDFEQQVIFDRMLIPFALLGLPATLLSGAGIVNHLLAALGGGLLFLLLAIITRGGIGGGDIKLIAALGLWLGSDALLSVVAAGLVLGGIAALLLLITGKKKRGEYFAYGPCFTIIALLAALS